MKSIKGKNTKPELAVRKILWSKGIRYRIHDKSVFGVPDISNKKRRLAIFIDGCFWHGCKKCYKEPTTNVEFWRSKIKRNKGRRIEVKHGLKMDGWEVIEVWEHDVNGKPEMVAKKILTRVKWDVN